MPKEPRKVGLVDGKKFHPCPEKHVCVSTQAPQSDETHYIEPIKYSGSQQEAMKTIKDIIKAKNRNKILEETENYIHAVFTTLILRFKDDVEFLFDDTNKLIHFRSQSRVGGYDWNKNRKRMENIRELFSQQSS